MTGGDMGGTPLYDALRSHISTGRESMHTPGHKGRADILRGLDASFDLTELPDTDSLYEAEGAIAAAERLAARAFDATATAISAGGCTLAIQAMLRCCCRDGDEVIMSRVAHRSAVNTCALLGLRPVWLWPEQDTGAGIPGQVSADGVRQALRDHPASAAVYITSPDYFGCMADVPAIARECAEAGVPLVVDNAHGSHLIAFDHLHPLSLGAAMTADSAHKTLPVLTGGAWLHCAANAGAGYADMKNAMSLFGSTSPSYLVMASLDLSRSWLETEGKAAFKRLANDCCAIRETACERGIQPPDGLTDPVRITLLTGETGIDGGRLGGYLRERGFEPELVCPSAVVLLPSPFTPRQSIERLNTVLREMPRTVAAEHAPSAWITSAQNRPRCVMSPREAILAERERIPVRGAVGRTAARAECPCPPGVPIIMPGEQLDRETIEELTRSGILETEVVR